jgi:hypothetical protein
VLGLTFTRSGIEALTAADVDLDDVLTSLRRKEILSVDNDPRSPERGQFRFVQALLRGVAYDTLSRRDRKARHVAVAEHLSTNVEGEAIAGVLAQHYLDAAAAVPEDDDVQLLQQRAAEMFERAALHAADVGAPVDALTHYASIMELDATDETIIRVAGAATALARRAGTRISQVLGWVEHALQVPDSSGTEEDRLALRLARGQLRYAGGIDFESAQADAEFVLDASIGVPERVHLLGAAARHLSVSAQITGNHQLAQRAVTAALEDVERYGDDAEFAMLLDALSMWFGLAGYRRLTGLVRRAAAEQYGVRDSAAISLYGNLAAGLVPDDPAEAAIAARFAIECAQTFGMNEVMGLGHLLAASLNLGRWADAEQLLDERRTAEHSELLDWETYLLAGSAVLAWEKDDATLLLSAPDESAKDSTDPVVVAWWQMYDAARTALAGQVVEGGQSAARAVETVGAIGLANEDVPLAFSFAADMLLESGDLETLERITAPLAALPRGPRFRLLHGQLLRAQALLTAEPVDGLRQSVEVLDGIGASFWAARVRVDLAQSLVDAGEAGEAIGVIGQAEPLLREIGARRALRRIESLRERDELRALAVPVQVSGEPSPASIG